MNKQREYPCEFCDSQAELEERLVSVHRERSGKHFIFEHVPARVCKACGHRYFSWEVAEQMDKLMGSPEAENYAQPVPVIEIGQL